MDVNFKTQSGHCKQLALEQFKHLEIKNSTFYKLDKDGYFINMSPGGENLASGVKVL